VAQSVLCTHPVAPDELGLELVVVCGSALLLTGGLVSGSWLVVVGALVPMVVVAWLVVDDTGAAAPKTHCGVGQLCSACCAHQVA